MFQNLESLGNQTTIIFIEGLQILLNPIFMFTKKSIIPFWNYLILFYKFYANTFNVQINNLNSSNTSVKR